MLTLYQIQEMQRYDFTIEFNEPVRDWYLTDAEAEALRGRQIERENEIYMRGRIEGEQILSEQLIQQRAQMQELQNGVFESLRKSIPSVVAQCEQTLIELAIEVCEKLVSGLPVSAEMVTASIREALRQIADSSEFTVYLNPTDLELLQRMNSASDITQHQGIRLVASSEVSRGGCMVQTRFGTIDNRRETKIKIIKQSLQC